MSESQRLDAALVLRAVGKGMEVSLAVVKVNDPLRLPYFSKLLVSAYGTCKADLTPDELVEGFLHQRKLLAEMFAELGHDPVMAHLMSAPVQANIIALPGVRAAWARIMTEERDAAAIKGSMMGRFQTKEPNLSVMPQKGEDVEPKD
jgi:hypothetical protein